MHQVLIVNTRPAPFIQANQHLLDDQVPLDKASHGFLDHDSYIACHELHDVAVREIENALVADMDNIKTMLSDTCRVKCVEVVEKTVNLMPLHQRFITDALKP